ncbi:histidine decarboxylase [Kitasatospora sp. NBC_00240]|uniref:histidine decarboxylase n=1 Tax=Kitasatospora sp. NBC_00240 TaxID=2903567 RepID=UPI002250634D|nr:histidine decarboxylase [Kitasatospora sp. NBC_00240]MCX5212162.1 histidine decarboxylase [Kitasatospora sp. NBC_00240]
MSRTDTLTVPAGRDEPALPEARTAPLDAAGLRSPAQEPDVRDFELPAGGLDDGQRLRALDTMDAYLTSKRRYLLGYQATQEMGGSAFDLGRFMHHNINNLGDPFQSGGYKPNTKVVERAVLDYYAALWHAKGPYDAADPESYWGYVLSMGSTEGNMYALWNARDYLSGKALIQPPAATPDGTPRYLRAAAEPGNPNAHRPVAFYSEDTHYSFAKAVHVLGVETFHAVGTEQYPDECPLAAPTAAQSPAWPAEVPSRKGPSGHTWDGTGEIDIDALAVLVEFFAAKGHPIFVSLNLGSTFKGAHDDVREVCERLLPIFEKHGLIRSEVAYGKDPSTGEPLTDLRRRFWIHVDGALGAGYAPFLRMAAADPAGFDWAPDTTLPEFDFGVTLPTREFGDVDMVSSIAMSGHKWPGAPWPCGIYMTKVKYQISPPSQPEYIGAPDTTFAGSRNGFSPLILWDHLSRHSYRDQVDRIRRAQELAAYLEQQLRLLELEKDIELWPARTPGAITVRFRKPSPELVAKWSLSSQDVLLVPGDERTRRSYVHVFLMSSVDRAKLDELLADLGNDYAVLGRG